MRISLTELRALVREVLVEAVKLDPADEQLLADIRKVDSASGGKANLLFLRLAKRDIEGPEANQMGTEVTNMLKAAAPENADIVNKFWSRFKQLRSEAETVGKAISSTLASQPKVPVAPGSEPVDLGGIKPAHPRPQIRRIKK